MLPKSAPPEESGTTEVSAVNVFVLIPEVPLSIAPNPEVMEPPSKAPTEVIFVWAAVVKVPAISPKATLPTVPLNTSEEFVASAINVNTLAESS